MVRLEVTGVHDETVNDDRPVQPARRVGAVLGVLAGTLVRVMRVADEHGGAVIAFEDDIGDGVGAVREPPHLAEAECAADPGRRPPGVLVGEHRDHASLVHRDGQ